MASSGRFATPSPRTHVEAAGAQVAGRQPRSEDALRADLKRFLVRHLRLDGVAPESIDDEAPLVGGGLDLDSIDVLELVTGVEKRYGLRFEDPDLVQRVFTSVGSVARYIVANRGER